MGETRKIVAILVADVVGYSRLVGADEDRNAVAAAGPAQRPHRSRRRRPSRAHRQAHGRRKPDRVPQRGRGRALRDRGAERHGGTQFRPAARAPHRVSHRHSSRGRGRGERRRPDGRRRQYRRPAGRNRQARARSVCPKTPIARSEHGSISRSPISARPTSRISPSRSGFIRCKSVSPPRSSPRRQLNPLRPKSPWRTSHRPTGLRSRSCRSRT